ENAAADAATQTNSRRLITKTILTLRWSLPLALRLLPAVRAGITPSPFGAGDNRRKRNGVPQPARRARPEGRVPPPARPASAHRPPGPSPRRAVGALPRGDPAVPSAAPARRRRAVRTGPRRDPGRATGTLKAWPPPRHRPCAPGQ